MPSSLVVSGSVFAPIIVNWRTIEGTINEKEVIDGMVVLDIKSICAYIRVCAPVREWCQPIGSFQS